MCFQNPPATCEQCMRCVNYCPKLAIFQKDEGGIKGKNIYYEPSFKPLKMKEHKHNNANTITKAYEGMKSKDLSFVSRTKHGEAQKVVLKFCIYCGNKVSPYNYSSSGYTDIYDYGNQPEDFIGGEGVLTYKCGCSEGESLAPNPFNTGWICSDCGNFMNMFATYCGVCSKKLKYE